MDYSAIYKQEKQKREELKQETFNKLDEFIKKENHKISDENIYAGKKLIEAFLLKLSNNELNAVNVIIRDGYLSLYDGYKGDIDVVFANMPDYHLESDGDRMLYFDINTQYEVGDHFDGVLGEDNLNTFMIYTEN